MHRFAAPSRVRSTARPSRRATSPVTPRRRASRSRRTQPLSDGDGVDARFADLAAALESAGVTESRPRTVTILVSESDSFKVSIAGYLSRTLSTDVLTVSVRSLPWSDYLTALQNGNFDLYLGEVRLTANWDISSLARTGGALNYGRYADEQCNTLLDAFSLNETDQTARALYRYLAQSAPIAPIAFKTASVLTPSGLIDGLNPTVSSPFYGIEGWTVHFDKG